MNDMLTLNERIIRCRLCPRLVSWREEVARQKRRAFRDQEYWGKPVPGFGDSKGRVMVIGLAPGAHGSNRTGRMFTGDASGNFLYSALYNAGFANRFTAESINDGLILSDLFISAVCRCAPPGNKPDRMEMDSCQTYLLEEIELIKPNVYVALGRIAFDRMIITGSLQHYKWVFKHGASFQIDEHHHLFCSYHPSQQNTQTGRLNRNMFDGIWSEVKELLK